MIKRISNILARFIVRRSQWLIALALIITAAAIPGITMLETETGFSALVADDADISVNNNRYGQEFGGESFTIMMTGSQEDILSAANFEKMARLADFLESDSRYLGVTSPLSLLEAVTGSTFAENPQIIMYAARDETGNLSPVISALFPDAEHALIRIIPAGNLNDDESLSAAQNIEGYLEQNPFTDTATTVITDAGLINSITVSIGRNIAILLGLAVVAMIIVLLVTFRVHWRLLSLGMVGIAAVWTFGLMGYLSVPMSMATMAVLPILIGLGIDFSIQFHNRYQEEIARNGSVGEAIVASITSMLPVVGVGMLATIAGFITLFVSKVPMIKDFGLMLATGIIISYILGLFLLHSVINVADRRTKIEKLQRHSKKSRGRIERILTAIGKNAIRHTAWVAVLAIALGVTGGYFDARLAVNTDYEELMPQDEPALMNVRYLREITGSGGRIHFMVENEDISSPEVLAWMKDWGERATSQFNEVRSVNSLATLVTQTTGGAIPPAEHINAIIDASPRIFTRDLISENGEMASVSFGISYLQLEALHDLIIDLEEAADAPAGISVAPVGTLALGAETIDAVIGSRMLMNLLCLSAVFVIILIAYRKLVSSMLMVVPVAAVIAWSSLAMFLINIPSTAYFYTGGL